MYYTVSQIGEFVSNIFKAEVYLHNISVYGEVSGFKISQNHAYFTLKDENAQLACSCFNYRKTYVPKDGETVVIKCSPNFYAKGGKLTFIVDLIEPQGKGDLYLKIEQLKKQLFEEGLFDDKYKKPIPKYCSNVGVVTSKTGAVIQDICSTIRRKNKNINVLLIDTKVQGIGAVEEIVNGINTLDTMNLDAIIVARGGGSVEDLMPFNDEKIARTIFNAKTPIISAVGHETDYTICDMVADVRCLTPTAAGELVSYDESEIIDLIINMLNVSLKEIARKKDVVKEDLVELIDELMQSFNDKYKDNKNILISCLDKLNASINKKVLLKQDKYVVLNQKINELGNMLNQKFSISITKDGNKIIGLTGIEKGDNIMIKSNNINLSCLVTDKKVDYDKE